MQAVLTKSASIRSLIFGANGLVYTGVRAFSARKVDLKGTKTHKNLVEAFQGESMANRRYLYFAKRADVEGHPQVASVFRSTAEGETGHAFGHLDFLLKVGDPATNEPIGDSTANLKSAIAGETYEYTNMYPGMARTARDEGFEEVAEWFDTLSYAEKSHSNHFNKALSELKQNMKN